jgi:hypothetical protein
LLTEQFLDDSSEPPLCAVVVSNHGIQPTIKQIFKLKA